MHALLWLINTIITIYVWLLIAQAVLSWLLAFGVINRYNRTVSVIGDFLYRVTEPALRPILASNGRNSRPVWPATGSPRPNC